MCSFRIDVDPDGFDTVVELSIDLPCGLCGYCALLRVNK